MTDKQKVLIIRLSSLGDVIFNIPLANALKQNNYEVSWLVGEKGLDVIQNNPCVDKVFFAPVEKWKKNKNIFQNIKEMIAIIKDLRNEHFDIAIDSQMLMKSILWTKFCGAQRRIIAKDAKEFSIIGANEIIPAIKDKFNRNMVNANLRFAQYLGLNTEKTTVSLPPSSDEIISNVNDLLKDLDTSKPIAVIAPTTTWIGKHWDKDNWKELIKKIENDYTLIFTGTKKDENYINYIGGDRHLSLAGKTNLKEFIEVLRRANLVISLDNGATHLAWATQKPKVLSIFCCTPKGLYAPIDDKCLTVSTTSCTPCHHRKCQLKNNKYICTKSPSVNDVIEGLNTLINNQ